MNNIYLLNLLRINHVFINFYTKKSTPQMNRLCLLTLYKYSRISVQGTTDILNGQNPLANYVKVQFHLNGQNLLVQNCSFFCGENTSVRIFLVKLKTFLDRVW